MASVRRGSAGARGRRLPAVFRRDARRRDRAARSPPRNCEIAVLNGPVRGPAAAFARAGSFRCSTISGRSPTGGARAANAARCRRCSISTPAWRGSACTPREFDRLVEAGAKNGAIGWRAAVQPPRLRRRADHPLNEAQRIRFAAAPFNARRLPASLAASSGIFLGRSYHFDFVRPGAALYGVNPQPGTPNPMRQVVRLKGKILQVRDVDTGQPVGYGAAHVMAAAGRVGHRRGRLRRWLAAIVEPSRRRRHRRQRVPFVGRISMDLDVFDVTGIDPELAGRAASSNCSTRRTASTPPPPKPARSATRC